MSMGRFLELLKDLDEHTGSLEKESYVVNFIHDVTSLDAAWATYLLVGKRQRKVIASGKLKLWVQESSGLPSWLFDECYAEVGDLAETISLVMANYNDESIKINALVDFTNLDLPLAEFLEKINTTVSNSEDDVKKTLMQQLWLTRNRSLIFFMTKILTGSFRIGVSGGLMQRAIAKAFNKSPADVADLLVGNWKPSENLFLPLQNSSENFRVSDSKPFPFCLASPLTGIIEDLDPPSEWFAEWKWDGIRAQIVKTEASTWIWSRGEELISDSFPDLVAAMIDCPLGTILDGEIVAWDVSDKMGSFSQLQKRLGRRSPSEKFCVQNPVSFLAYDCLKYENADLRNEMFSKRREVLTEVIAKIQKPKVMISEFISFTTWQDLAKSRDLSRGKNVEGLMLKKRDSVYKSGRKRGLWWKWKIDPFEVDAVLLYAQPGHGRRASLYTDYTFALWDQEKLIPFAKAYSGLTDAEILELDSWIRNHTKEKFGPVRSLEALQVFELHFEGIALSKRHKSGVSVRFPRIARWRKDKKPDEANTLDSLKELLKVET